MWWVLSLPQALAQQSYAEPFDHTTMLANFAPSSITGELAPLGQGLMGEQYDLNTGQISFRHVDVSIPGNSGLPVEFARVARGHGFEGGVNAHPNRPLGTWDVDVPFIAFRQLVTHHNAPTTGSYEANKIVSIGMKLNVPGQGIKPVRNLSGQQVTSGGGSVTSDLGAGRASSPGFMATNDHWLIYAPGNHSEGTGYLAISPTGVKYKLDQVIRRYAGQFEYKLLQGEPWVRADTVYYMPSVITDAYGNTVQYTYNNFGVTQIVANDGRQIDITYQTSRISQVTANGRTWTYAYKPNSDELDRVTLPNSTYWELDVAPLYEDPHYLCEMERQSDQAGQNAIWPVRVRHPSGAIGEFDLRMVSHIVEDPISYPYVPGDPGPATNRATACSYGAPFAWQFFSLSLTEKRLYAHSGATADKWTYNYHEEPGQWSRASATMKWAWGATVNTDLTQRTVIDSEGHRTVTYINRVQAGTSEGQIDRIERYETATSTTPLEVVHYDEYDSHQTQVVDINGAPLSTQFRHLPQKVRIVRGADIYTTEYFREFNPSNTNYAYFEPHKIIQSSNLQTDQRTIDLEFDAEPADWIIRLLTKRTIDGKLIDELEYDTGFKGKIHRHFAFGTLSSQFGYHSGGVQAGALRYHELFLAAGGVDRRTEYHSWKRGLPKRIDRNDGNSVHRDVDDNGWVTSQTDAVGTVVSYEYNSMGWLTKIDRPGSWGDSIIDYQNVGTSNFHQRERQGDRYSQIYYDGFFRPWLTRSWDNTDQAGTASVVRTAYDGLGRPVFTSHPSADWSPQDGFETTYDALGRVTKVRENISPYATTTTNYLNGHRTQIIDPEGHHKNIHRSGYGSPNDGYVTNINEWTGGHTHLRTTVMAYDDWGNIRTARQYGNSGGFSADFTQTYSYDGSLRLCQHHTPEQGSKLFRYNHAGELTQWAEGQPQTSGCGSMPSGATINQSYTLLGQPDITDFPGSTPDINRDYDLNGNPYEVFRGSGSTQSRWSYRYDYLGDADLLREETLRYEGRTFRTDYNNQVGGQLNRRKLVTGDWVAFYPNALGQATAATNLGTTDSYASNLTYHRNGMLSQMNLGNGSVFNMDINARQQVEKISYSSGFDLRYTYDNVGRVLSINDFNDDVEGDRTFSYDGMGRLKTAQGPWGSGSFSYDPVGNIMEKVLGGRTVDIEYDSNNRLERYSDSATNDGWLNSSYDSRGNVLSDGKRTFVYDLANQPTQVTVGSQPIVSSVIPSTIDLGGAGYTKWGSGMPASGPPSDWTFANGVASIDIAPRSWAPVVSRNVIHAQEGERYRVTLDIKADGTVQDRPGETGRHIGILIRRLDGDYQEEAQRDAAVKMVDLQGDGVWRTYTLEYTATSNDTFLRPRVYRRAILDGNGTVSIRNFRAERIEDGSTTTNYTYDGNLKRIKAVEGGVTTYFVYGSSGALLHKLKVEAGQPDEATDYISVAGRSLARITNGEVTYVYADHLGSNSVLADDQGNVIAKETLTPYGEVWAGSSPTNDNGPTFTGHVRDSATGLTYMQARYYNPVVGRFLAKDPVEFDTGGPAYFNRYSYALNSPTTIIDPMGLCGTRAERYQDCTINIHDREDLTPEEEAAVAELEAQIKIVGGAIADGGTEEEVAAWEEISAFNIRPKTHNSKDPQRYATANVGTDNSVDVWKGGVDAVAKAASEGNVKFSPSDLSAHIVIHEVYHFTASDRNRRARALAEPFLAQKLAFKRAEYQNDVESREAGKRLGVISEGYRGAAYRIGTW
ncbi:hypothetical protein HK107_06575 [Parvularcula sp. ZS-1/3]|uniref:Teneurin-like YD-shell domain-containing protein n=1 Tax=Parvularcula mediterranea TaxID=2732508 RepID=A0A7Y3W4Z0_9PROT|nr:RHS repeat-associated core domain-containing protein [Parvularcula mediterranea]NNU15983.1 hypothetical protein [Parvularcula mediterranea]